MIFQWPLRVTRVVQLDSVSTYTNYRIIRAPASAAARLIDIFPRHFFRAEYCVLTCSDTCSFQRTTGAFSRRGNLIRLVFHTPPSVSSDCNLLQRARQHFLFFFFFFLTQRVAIKTFRPRLIGDCRETFVLSAIKKKFAIQSQFVALFI